MADVAVFVGQPGPQHLRRRVVPAFGQSLAHLGRGVGGEPDEHVLISDPAGRGGAHLGRRVFGQAKQNALRSLISGLVRTTA
ncbi:hypothetical protein [Amycolatopsis sp. NPDC003731]